MLQRALVRQEVPLRYSEGFNPRPRLSLPLPRSVGVASDDEVLCALVNLGDDYDLNAITEGISSQLPDQCRVSSVMVRESKVTLQPRSAVYELPLKQCAVTDDFQAGIQVLKNAAGGKVPILVTRKSSKRKVMRQVDVSPYVGSVKMENETLTISCIISQGGSIRIDELMGQLGITDKDLSGPVKRASVEWVEN